MSFIPEHSKAAYSIGASYKAVYIEPDVVSSKDGVLLCLHGNELSGTTDVASHPEFADRETTKFVEGWSTKDVTGWFTEDFTMAEMKTLRLKARAHDGLGPLDGIYQLNTFEEMLDFRASLVTMLDRPELGVYPETKLSTYFTSIGLPLEIKVIDTLESKGLCTRETPTSKCIGLDKVDGVYPVYLQSFDAASLKVLTNLTDIPMARLIHGGDAGKEMVDTDDKITAISKYSTGLSIPVSWDREFRRPVVAKALELGLLVHAWSADMEELDYQGLEDDGVEGVFSNNVAFGEGYIATRVQRDAICEEAREEELHGGNHISDNQITIIALLFPCGVILGVLCIGCFHRQGKKGRNYDLAKENEANADYDDLRSNSFDGTESERSNNSRKGLVISGVV